MIIEKEIKKSKKSPIPVIITFTEEQKKSAIEECMARNNAKDESFREKSTFIKTEGTNLPKASDLTHILGVLSEKAFATFSGCDYDRNIYKVRDSGIDFGKDVEMKCITYMGDNPELKIPVGEFDNPRRTPKKYVLARINKNNLNVVELLGEITREKFEEAKTEKTYRGHSHINYIVGIEHMSSVIPWVPSE